MSMLMAFSYKAGALGAGNDVGSGDYTLEEAALRCLQLGAVGFTHAGGAPQPHQKVRVYFKSSRAGNTDPSWATYTPHFTHKVGALGGGNDLETGHYTLHDAWLHSLKMPACVGFTYQGVPNQQGQVQCYFKSAAGGNADPNWQTYLKNPGATLTQHAHLPVALPAGVSVLSTNHPVDDAPAAAPPRNGLTLAQAIEWCQSMADCSGMWYYDNGRTCPKAHWDPSPANFSRVIPGGKFYQVKPMTRPASILFDHKVGALGGGNDLEAGHYTLHDAWLHSLKMPACVGFTYQGVPNQQGQVQCYFKSSAAGNADPNWQTYLKKAGANVAKLGQQHGQHGAHRHAHAQKQAHARAQAQSQRAQVKAQAQAQQAAKAQAQAQAQQHQAAMAQAQAQAQAQQAAIAQAQAQAAMAQAAMVQPQVCPQCQGKGGLGPFGPVPRGDIHWKRDCPNCEGRCTTVNTIPCAVCQGKGGQGTFGPCGLLDVHFKSMCVPCGGKGFTAPLGQPPVAVAAQPIHAVPVQPGAGQTLAAFLGSVRLSEFGPALAGLGATTVQDLKDMTPQDYESIGMKKLQMNRMLTALK